MHGLSFEGECFFLQPNKFLPSSHILEKDCVTSFKSWVLLKNKRALHENVILIFFGFTFSPNPIHMEKPSEIA